MSSRGFASISHTPTKMPQTLTHNVSHRHCDVLSPQTKAVLPVQPSHRPASSCISLLLQAISSHQGLVNLHSSIAFVWKWRCIFWRPTVTLRSWQTFQLSPVVLLWPSIWEWMSVCVWGGIKAAKGEINRVVWCLWEQKPWKIEKHTHCGWGYIFPLLSAMTFCSLTEELGW